MKKDIVSPFPSTIELLSLEEEVTYHGVVSFA